MTGLLEQYRNPVPFLDEKRHTNPDPFVMRWCGRWYCYATDELGVKVSISEDLVHWRFKGYAIQEPEYRNYWAPSVLYQNGIFYMYYSNIPAAADDCHDEHLKLAVSDSPVGPFQRKKTFFKEFSIDSHPVAWNGRLYLFYSVNNWLGSADRVAGTCILVDELVTPEELAGHPRPAVLPSLRQEVYAENRFGDGRDWYTIEGAASVVHGDRFWLLYSANAYLNEDYFIGTAVAPCKSELLDMAWEKYPDAYTWRPLLKKNRDMEGTGHNTVTKAPNMLDDWIVYHARRMDEVRDPALEQREMCIDPLWFNGRELLCFGPTADVREAPGKPQLQVREKSIRERTIFYTESACYYAEFWISARRQHTGTRYGLYLSWQSERDYLEFQLHTGRGEAQVICCADGISRCVQRVPLEKQYDYTVPHLIRVSRCFDEYSIWMDEGNALTFTDSESASGGGELGIIPYFTELTLHSLSVTEAAILQGGSLRHLGKFYDVTPGWIDDTGYSGLNGHTELRFKLYSRNFTEEFQLEVCGGENAFVYRCPGLTGVEARNKRDSYAVYHIVRDGREKFILDGTETQWHSMEGAGGWELENIKIAVYRFTKN